MNATLLDVLKEHYPEAVARWDHYDYKILVPMSLDDAPEVCILLKNRRCIGAMVALRIEGRKADVRGDSTAVAQKKGKVAKIRRDSVED